MKKLKLMAVLFFVACAVQAQTPYDWGTNAYGTVVVTNFSDRTVRDPYSMILTLNNNFRALLNVASTNAAYTQAQSDGRYAPTNTVASVTVAMTNANAKVATAGLKVAVSNIAQTVTINGTNYYLVTSP